MAKGSPIEWLRRPGTDPATQNIVMGCTPRSEGCGIHRWEGDREGGCYAPHEVVRQQHLPGRDGLVGRNLLGSLSWTGKVTMFPDRILLPLKWRKPCTVFVSALAELFDDQVPDEFIAAQWCVMYWTSRHWQDSVYRLRTKARPVHTYIILTKLPARLRAFMRRWVDIEQREEMVAKAVQRGWIHAQALEDAPWMPAVLDNVWLGVSVENQKWADIRLPILLDTPAVEHVASCEPLLGPLDLRRYLDPVRMEFGAALSWVIVGGESDKDGRHARPMHPDWPVEILRQCRAYGRPMYFKQWGAFSPLPSTWPGPSDDPTHRRELWVVSYDGRFCHGVTELWATKPPEGASRVVLDLRASRGNRLHSMYLVGKHRAGDELDGKTYHEFPGDTGEAITA